jgi:hypothetical protein
MDTPPTQLQHRSAVRAVLKAECAVEVARQELERAYEVLATARQLYAAHQAGLIFASPRDRSKENR